MNQLGKPLSLCLAAILAFSVLLLIAEPIDAQAIPKPPVPELTVKFVNHSYDVPSSTTTTTNPYTGENTVTTEQGYHIQNDSFVISITSPPTSSDEMDGKIIQLFYLVQSKGHYSTYWSNLTYTGGYEFLSSNTGYVEKVMQLSGNNGTEYYENGYNNYGYAGVVGGQYGGQVDFRVCSLVGYTVTVQDDPNPFNFRYPYHTEWVILQSSDWSNILTVSIPDGSVSSSTSPNPSVPEFPFSAILLLLVVIPLLGVAFKKKRHRPQITKSIQ